MPSFSQAIHYLRIIFRGKHSQPGTASRSIYRYRSVALTSGTIIFARVLNALTGLATVPLTLNYLGGDLFGIWMALTSFVAMLSFADLGLGSGIQNQLIYCNGSDDKNEPSKIVGTGLILHGTIAALLILVAFFVLPLVPLDRLIHVTDDNASRWLLPTAQVMLVSFAFGLPTNLVQRICDAYQVGYWGYGALSVGRLIAFISVIAAAYYKWSLPVLAGLYMLLPFVVMLCIGAVVIRQFLPWTVPSFKTFKIDRLKRLMSTGVSVMGCDIGYAALNSAPALLIAHTISAAAVGPFAVTQKAIGAMSIIMSPVLCSLWGPLGEAATRGDIDWVRRAINRARKGIVLLIVPAYGILLIVGQDLIRVWTRNDLAVPSFVMLAGVVTWSVVFMFDQLYTIFLNSLNRFALRAAIMISFGTMAILLTCLFGSQIGADGIVWCYVIFGFIPVFLGNWIQSIKRIQQLESGVIA
ncbi:MAG: hypothetical protein V2B19_04975 [Pseudomonadota bacterium]